MQKPKSSPKLSLRWWRKQTRINFALALVLLPLLVCAQVGQRAGRQTISGGTALSYSCTQPNCITRTVSDKLSEAVSIKDFGAKCDGVTNDINFIQTAINAVCTGSPPGGTVLIPAGVCGVTPVLGTTFLRVPSFCTIRGTGRNSELRVINNNNYFSLFYNNNPVQQVWFDNFRINQQVANQQGSNIFIANSDGFGSCVDGVNTCNQNAIGYTSLSGIKITNMVFDDMPGQQPINLFNDWPATSPGPCIDATITNNYFRYRHGRVGSHGYSVATSQSPPLLPTAICTSGSPAASYSTGGPVTCPAPTVTTATESGTTVTITTPQRQFNNGSCTVGVNCPDPIVSGQTVTVSGVGVGGYNGTWLVTSVNANGLSFTYTNTASTLGNSSGGTVSTCCYTFCPNCKTDNSTIYVEGCNQVFDGNTFESDAPSVVGGRILTATSSGSTVTLGTNSAHGLGVGSFIYVNGLSPNDYNGLWLTISPTSGTTITYTALASNLVAGSGNNGTVTIWPVTSGAVTAMEIHGGNAVASNNVIKYYLIGFAVVNSQNNVQQIFPNDVVLNGNTINGAGACGQMSLEPSGVGTGPGGIDVPTSLFRGLTINANVCSVQNASRGVANSGTIPVEYYGWVLFGTGSYDQINITKNTVTFERFDTRTDASINNTFSAGILFEPQGSVSNWDIEGNIIKNAPYQGISIAANNLTNGGAGTGIQPISTSVTKSANVVTVLCSTTANCGANSGCTAGAWCHQMTPDQLIYVNNSGGGADTTNFPSGFKRVTNATATTFTYAEPAGDSAAHTNTATMVGIFPTISKGRMVNNLIIDAGLEAQGTACVLTPCNNDRAAIQLGAMWPLLTDTRVTDVELSDNFIRDTSGKSTINGVYALDLQQTLGSNVRAYHNSIVVDGTGAFTPSIETVPHGVSSWSGVTTPVPAGDVQTFTLNIPAGGSTVTPDPSSYGRTQINVTGATSTPVLTINAPLTSVNTPYVINISNQAGASAFTITWNAAYKCNTPPCPAGSASSPTNTNNVSISFSSGPTAGSFYETSRVTTAN